MKSKKQSPAVKAVRDIRSVPPQAYILASDGRKLKHLCRERRALLFQISTHANPDGTGVYPSEYTLARDMGKSRRQIVYLMKDLRTLGFVVEDGWQIVGTDAKGNPIRTRKRKLVITKIIAAGRALVPTAQDTPEGSAQDTSSTAQDTQGQCARYAEPVRKIGEGSAQDSYCAEPASEPTVPTDLPTKDGWGQFILGLPEQIRYAVVGKAQRQQLEQQLNELGCGFLTAGVAHWIKFRSKPIDDLQVPWHFWLQECTAHIAEAPAYAKVLAAAAHKLTPEYKADLETQVAAARKADAEKWDAMTKPKQENEMSLADYLTE